MVRNKILNQQNWLYGSVHLYLQSWHSNFYLIPLAVYKEPIWIRLYNLLMEYWGDSSLECIGISLGTLLAVDEEIIENDSYLYARIKIVAVKKVPSSIYLKVGRSKEKGVENSPQSMNSLSQQKGCSNTKIEYDRVSDEDFLQAVVLDNLDPRCISQSANILLGKAKGI
ncbi:hypothetical protein SUGI_1187560 [Cryptomeria japonica]|nr:hypothetical protein SUGI_1187560 [Cryptomeria japonica]